MAQEAQGGELTQGEDSKPPTQGAIAAHEAGHAVAAWALGRSVDRMWIDTGGGTAINDHWTELPLLDQVAIWRAGACATDMLAIPAPGWMATEDRKKVFQLLAGLPDRECEDHIERGGERAYELLEANEAMLRAVADRLEHTSSLDQDAFSKIADACGNKIFAPSG